jgi:hypothetical protein
MLKLRLGVKIVQVVEEAANTNVSEASTGTE